MLMAVLLWVLVWLFGVWLWWVVVLGCVCFWCCCLWGLGLLGCLVGVLLWVCSSCGRVLVRGLVLGVLLCGLCGGLVCGVWVGWVGLCLLWCGWFLVGLVVVLGFGFFVVGGFVFGGWGGGVGALRRSEPFISL
ncbi:hypothetical protein [Neisseria sp. P0024.S006]|uniref:hypothetical protein n=1 Tax=Neisseria sp. P0024.S006 TaxID=3436850 RepID=UPI003F7D9643